MRLLPQVLARQMAMWPTARRPLTTLAKPHYAMAFDIDGVLIKGHRAIPEARRALQLLNGNNSAQRRVPFILLTNGGGVTEAAKAAQISQMLDVEILPEQVVLSHSPMQALVPQYKDKRVLVVGGKGHKCLNVAKSYGFTNVVTPEEVHQWKASVWPFATPTPVTESSEYPRPDFTNTPIEAVMVFHDSRDWGRDIQIVLDAVSAENGLLGTIKNNFSVQDVPVYFSNNDIIWSTDFPVSRLAQGSFKVALESVFTTLTGQRLQSTSFGKPYATTYAFAEKVIQSLMPKDAKDTKPRVYAVGDNPAADIQGANGYGWTSLLVRTGVFKGGDNALDFPADVVCNNVLEAVEWVIEKEEKNL